MKDFLNEVIAALGGQPATNLPDVVLQWVRGHETLDIVSLIPSALQAIDRVLGPSSKLNQLWEEDESEYPVAGSVLNFVCKAV